MTIVANVPVILPVVFADDIAWKIIGDITIAMTTPIANCPRRTKRPYEMAAGGAFRHGFVCFSFD